MEYVVGCEAEAARFGGAPRRPRDDSRAGTPQPFLHLPRL